MELLKKKNLVDYIGSSDVRNVLGAQMLLVPQPFLYIAVKDLGRLGFSYSSYRRVHGVRMSRGHSKVN